MPSLSRGSSTEGMDVSPLSVAIAATRMRMHAKGVMGGGKGQITGALMNWHLPIRASQACQCIIASPDKLGLFFQ